MDADNKFYGNFRQIEVNDEVESAVEEIRAMGFVVLENMIPESDLENYRVKIDEICRMQEEELGREYLEKINELNMARALLVYDDYFIKLITIEIIQKIVGSFLGDYFILNLQNAIINHPNEEHHQSSWHRDLPYQNFVISRPIAINVFFCIDVFSKETGATNLIPYTHKMETLPSDDYIKKHKATLNCPAGSVAIFDSMVLHQAGYNSSNIIRRGVNHIFSTPIMKQQYDFPAMLNGKFSDDQNLGRLLGYDSQVPASVKEWRQQRFNRLKARSKQ